MSITTYIIDDESQARERMVYLIKNFFYKSLQILGQSGKPKEALEQVLRLTPEILFLDVEMPLMSGFELLHQLQTNGYRGKIVFVTAYDHYSIKAIRANAFDYLVKPVDVDELRQCINRYSRTVEQEFNETVIRNFDLSKREMEIIVHLAKGLSSEEVAAEMFLSRHTVDTHRRNIHTKTGTRNSVELLNLLRGK